MSGAVHRSCGCNRTRPSARHRNPRAGFLSILVAVAGMLYADTAFAHTGTGLPGGFVQGFLHPFSGFDHLLAMVAVGLWGARLGRPLLYTLPVVFPVVMVVGAALAMFGLPLPSPELGIASSVIVLGACVALSIRAPVWLASLIVAAFALFHGDAHGRELPSAMDPVGYSLGFVFATGLLHVAGIALGALGDRRYGAIAVRGLGTAIAGVGGWFLMAALSA